MKFLCVCQGGNVRSSALAFILKWKHKQDAIPVGCEQNSREVRDILGDWADYIILMQDWDKSLIVPQRCYNKVRVVDVGPDRYGYNMHPDLIGFLSGVVDEWKIRDYKI